MWSLLYSNRCCNEKEQFYQHKNHLERVVNSKSELKISEPKKPSFLFKRAKKEQIEREKNNQINYQNGLILKKIVELETHKNGYHPHNINIKECPAFDKTKHNNFKQAFVNVENFKMCKRLMSAKPTYRTKESLNQYKKSKYLENLISSNNNNINPCLKFDTPINFKTKLDQFFSETSKQEKSQFELPKLKNTNNTRPYTSSGTRFSLSKEH